MTMFSRGGIIEATNPAQGHPAMAEWSGLGTNFEP